MPRVSKRPVSEKLLSKTYRLFYEVFSRNKGRDDFLLIIDDILSSSEKIMLSKRLAVIYLLIKGVDYRDIMDTLKVSSATVVFYASTFLKRNSKVRTIIENMLNKEKVLNFLDDFFADIMIHPGIYKGHWQMYWNHKRKQENRKILV